MSFIVLWVLGAAAGLGLLYLVIRGAVISGLKRVLIWRGVGELDREIETRRRLDGRYSASPDES